MWSILKKRVYARVHAHMHASVCLCVCLCLYAQGCLLRCSLIHGTYKKEFALSCHLK